MAEDDQNAEERARLKAQRDVAGKRIGHDCDADGCARTVDDGPLLRVNPRGRPGVFMCSEHAAFVNSWEQRIADPATEEGDDRG